MDLGLLSLVMMARHHGIAADEAQLRHEFGPSLFTIETILLGAKRLGMTAKLVKEDPDRLDRAPLPAVAIDKEGNFFIAVKYGYDSEDKSKARMVIQQPGTATAQVITPEEFLERWSGQFIFFTSKMTYLRDLSKFDFSWFIPAIVKYRRLLGEVMLISFVLQLIGLITPLGFQVVMDKVLVNHAMQTLNVIGIALLCAALFEAVLSGIRTWIFSHTSSKIDVDLGARLFRHLLSLPIGYFQARRVGDSVARVRELENIRSFLTGNAITLVMDVIFSFVFLFVMFLYSPVLTLIVVLSLPAYFILSMVLTPLLRARLNEKFNRGARNQAFLVESVTGIDTLKAMAVEPRWFDNWEKQLASYVSVGLSANNISILATSGITMVSKLVTVGIIWVGASLVVEGKLTIGQLVAFNMLSGQISGPIVRIAQLWTSFQQVGISMERLGDILNAPLEVVGQKTRVPRLSGAIEFDKVTFRYRPDSPDVLRKISFKIAPGEVIGIVGRSGSGKSTLAKLVQRLYVPNQGRVLIDGQDLAIIDTTSLRRQLGVVLQENILFTGSVRDNIALSNPALPIEPIIEAAKMAGAHEFICELAEGYDTRVGEHGSSLSGGQRQRIAIARALITNPRILIFDEATSSLDYESERIIQENMRKICAGRTVLIIAHRLSAVSDADRILVMERGEIVEEGSHEELVSIKDGLYAHLNELQLGLHRSSLQVR
ncbi:MAG: Toxin RTX-I translocation ATP-binding protein [Syntrophus sp. PtaB.Bin001]|nr:MAG: Toxin RTX-I translocation ATP-binding protein [Syntrophus sp. PtaB.Bin001]